MTLLSLKRKNDHIEKSMRRCILAHISSFLYGYTQLSKHDRQCSSSILAFKPPNPFHSTFITKHMKTDKLVFKKKPCTRNSVHYHCIVNNITG